MHAAVTSEVLPADDAAIARAANVLREGGLVAFPTETVYGLGADAANAGAVARLYAAKGRPSFNPLIAHVTDRAGASALARFGTSAERLAAAFWPGPLTLVLPRAEGCPVADLATAGLDTIAVRVPAHPVAHALLQQFGGAIVAPSANPSGRVSPTTAEHVRADLAGRIDLILDGGATEVGLESTIVACIDEPPVLVRFGGVARHAIEEALGTRLAAQLPPNSDAPLAPGQLASHYAPQKPLRLDATTVRRGEALLAFGPALPPGAAANAALVLTLSERGDLTEAAANLFAHLRALDASDAVGIAAMPIPPYGLGEAINDRLRRAAAPRCGEPLLQPGRDR